MLVLYHSVIVTCLHLLKWPNPNFLVKPLSIVSFISHPAYSDIPVTRGRSSWLNHSLLYHLYLTQPTRISQLLVADLSEPESQSECSAESSNTDSGRGFSDDGGDCGAQTRNNDACRGKLQ